MSNDEKDEKRREYQAALEEMADVMEEFTLLAEKLEQKISSAPGLRFSRGKSYPPIGPKPEHGETPDTPEKKPPNHKLK